MEGRVSGNSKSSQSPVGTATPKSLELQTKRALEYTGLRWLSRDYPGQRPKGGRGTKNCKPRRPRAVSASPTMPARLRNSDGRPISSCAAAQSACQEGALSCVLLFFYGQRAMDSLGRGMGNQQKKIKKRKKSLKRTEKLERAQPSRRMMGRATVGAQDTVSRPCLLGDNEGQRSRCKYLHSPVAAQPLFIYRSASLNAPSAVFTALPLPRCAGCEGQPSTERAVARGSRQATCPPVAALPGGIGHR